MPVTSSLVHTIGNDHLIGLHVMLLAQMMPKALAAVPGKGMIILHCVTVHMYNVFKSNALLKVLTPMSLEDIKQAMEGRLVNALQRQQLCFAPTPRNWLQAAPCWQHWMKAAAATRNWLPHACP